MSFALLLIKIAICRFVLSDGNRAEIRCWPFMILSFFQQFYVIIIACNTREIPNEWNWTYFGDCVTEVFGDLFLGNLPKQQWCFKCVWASFGDCVTEVSDHLMSW